MGHAVLPGSAARFGGSSAIRFDIVISAFDAGQLTGNAAFCFDIAIFSNTGLAERRAELAEAMLLRTAVVQLPQPACCFHPGWRLMA
jgi:hypothetical protein